jgi:hypothetical protein
MSILGWILIAPMVFIVSCCICAVTGIYKSVRDVIPSSIFSIAMTLCFYGVLILMKIIK